ncbi:cytochrome P450 [Embleya scabrispora]|uniref:cytochrome P450 n=1 Tax=Embleya scabrispora TaxID=159449 RepID=UPI0013750BAE|nr:cytochrome P450 [Embleya scabrispora]
MIGTRSGVVRADDAPRMSEDELTDQIVTFYTAGMATSSATLAWALHLLARHPDIRRRLHEEVDTVVDDTASLEDLPALLLIGRIVTESLRPYPPVWILTRATSVGTALGALGSRPGPPSSTAPA